MAKAKDFEEMLEDLENIVSSLEKDNLKLDESISKFEEGMKLTKLCNTKLCNTKLEEAEKKITILLNENGEIKEENFFAE